MSLGDDVLKALKAQIASHSIVLYMRGTPAQPMCKPSADVVAALARSDVAFVAIDVQTDAVARANLPRVCHKQGFPQLFVHGEHLGAAEVVLELDRRQLLAPLLQDASRQRMRA